MIANYLATSTGGQISQYGIAIDQFWHHATKCWMLLVLEHSPIACLITKRASLILLNCAAQVCNIPE